MRALVTGGCGFVGRHVVKQLLALGSDVDITVVDNLSEGLHIDRWPEPPRRPVRFVHNDVRNFFKPNPADQFDIVFHLAAVVGGRMKIEGDPLVVATDLAIDADMFNWAVRAARQPKVIYFSSSAVYPVSYQTKIEHFDLTESMVDLQRSIFRKPDMTYGWAKMCGEYLARQAVEKYGLNVVIYRPFSGYGGDQSFDYPFPSLVQRVLRGENPITVWGNGEQVRDFIHIDDVIEAVFVTKDRLEAGDVLNIGSGWGVSFRKLVNIIGSVLNKPVSVAFDMNKPAGVFHRVADTTKLFKYFKPSIRLEEGIERVAKHLAKVDSVVTVC